MGDLQKVFQGHGVQFSQLHNSMANYIKIYKCFPHVFVLAPFLRFNNFNYYLPKVGQGHGVHFLQVRHFMANGKSTNVSRTILS